MNIVPGIIRRNWRLKVAAFGLAVFFWGIARSEPINLVRQTLSNIPVLVEVGDLDWTTAGDAEPAAVEVHVSGTLGSLGLNSRDLSLQIPIDQVGSTDTIVELRRDWVRSASARPIQVEDIIPQRVGLRFERVLPGAVPLTLLLEGSLPEGLALAQPLSLTPDVARVRGRASRVSGLESIALSPLDLGAVRQSGTFRLRMDTTGLGDLIFDVTEATVTVRLGEATERTIDSIPVALDSLPPGQRADEFTFDPATVSVTLRGERTRVEQIAAADILALLRGTSVAAIIPGGSSPVAIHVEGVPELVEAVPSVELVEVTREAEAGEGGGGGS